MTTPLRYPFKMAGHAEPALESRMDEMRALLKLFLPGQLTERTGVSYLELGQGRGEFHFALLGTSIVITYPDFHAIIANTDTALPAFKQALVLYYFLQSDGALPTRRWISFADLPEGRFYSSAFQGYTGDKLAKTFGMNRVEFCAACEKADGVSVKYGDASYCFHALPRMDLLLVYHLGDEDFSSTCKVLFDGNTGHYLPAEACAILGSSLVQKVLKVVGR